MGSESLLARMKSSSAVRRTAVVVLFAGLAAVGWLTIRRAPVEATVSVELGGRWPALRCVTLTYSEAESVDPLRQVKLFPGPGDTDFVDRPKLAPGSYRLEVAVDTEDGASVHERVIEHAPGENHRIEIASGSR